VVLVAAAVAAAAAGTGVGVVRIRGKVGRIREEVGRTPAGAG